VRLILFAGGDAVTGPSTVVKAVGAFMILMGLGLGTAGYALWSMARQ